MALSTVQANNKLVQYTKDINREYVRENAFSSYMGEDITAIIRLRNELKKGGEQMNIPLVTRLTNAGVSTGTLRGAEEAIDDYGCRVYIDFARNAVTTNAREEQIDSADTFGEAKPLLSDWGKELQRDEIIEALMALPSEAAPAGLGSLAGQRTNGLLFEASDATTQNAWHTANKDRILYGNAITTNSLATFPLSTAQIDSPTDIFKASSVSLMKYLAKNANPKIRPYKVTDGREYFVAFCGSLCFRDLKADLQIVNKDARSREGNGFEKNPIFQGGDEQYDGVIIHEVPEIDTYTQTTWNAILGVAGAGGTTKINPVFLCGQSALAMAWAQMAKPTELKEDDYGFLKGVGIQMAYGVSKLFKKHPKAGTALKQWGVVTGFFAATAV